jgi:5'-nucleotidase
MAGSRARVERWIVIELVRLSMAMQWDDTLVIGVASSALFDLSESHAVFTEHGEDEYRSFQEAQYESQLAPGIAFPFIRRLLGLNDLATGSSPVVEVIVLSRNDPETGARVMRSIETHGLPMTRAVFTQGPLRTSTCPRSE